MPPSLQQRLGIFAVARTGRFIFGLPAQNGMKDDNFRVEGPYKVLCILSGYMFPCATAGTRMFVHLFCLCMSFRRTSDLTYYEVKQLIDFHTRGGCCDLWIAPRWRAAPSAQAVSVL